MFLYLSLHSPSIHYILNTSRTAEVADAASQAHQLVTPTQRSSRLIDIIFFHSKTELICLICDQMSLVHIAYRLPYTYLPIDTF